MESKIAETNARIDVADVLRGLAVMGITTQIRTTPYY